MTSAQGANPQVATADELRGEDAAGPERPATPTVPLGRFQALVAESTRRREREQARMAALRDGDDTGAGGPGGDDWSDPSDDALLQLPTSQHPVERALRRRKEGLQRDQFYSLIRRACESFSGAPVNSLSRDQVLAYPWHKVDRDKAEAYRRDIHRQYDNTGSRNNNMVAVRAIVEECHKMRMIGAFRRDEVFEELWTVAPEPSRRGRFLQADELVRLLVACEEYGPRDWLRFRNTAIVTVFITTGMRVSELCRLDLVDWSRDAGELLLRETKNGRNHLLFVHPDLVPYLERWLRYRGLAAGPLFTSQRKNGSARINSATVRQMLIRRAEFAGIGHLGCHDFRRTFASTLLNEHDPALVSKLLNHKSLASTLVYDRRGEDLQRHAVGTLTFPTLDTISTRDGDRTDVLGRSHRRADRLDHGQGAA